MKKLTVLILLTLLSACGPSKEELEMRERLKQDSINISPQNQERLANGDTTNTEPQNNFSQYAYNIVFIQVSGCTYVSFRKVDNYDLFSIVHAGDCPNKVHEIKELEQQERNIY